ncbi:MAG: NUDIX hydrolase [Nanoarchaeota archaeon]|nr:NUDIX hydrolase [Nanoarchaeota archaeon]
MKHHAAIILRDGNKVLFAQRAATKKSLPNIWAFPSGTMEENESAEMTAVREAKEELEITVTVEKNLSTVELSQLGVALHLMVCTTDTPTQINLDQEEIQKTSWMTFEEFFKTFTDEQVGHGLIYLRKHPEIWKAHFR